MKRRQKETVIGAGQRRESFVEFLWELMSCWLLAVGTSLLQNVQLPYPLPTFDILWQTLVTVVLLALFSRRWFLMLIVSVQVLLLGLLLMLLLQLPILQSFAQAADFCGWFFRGMPFDETWSTGSGMIVLHILLNIGISMLMFFVVRVSRGAWPPLVLCFSLLVLIMTFGNPANNAAATAAYLAGCCPMIARDRYSGRRLFSGEEKYRVMGTRWGVSTAAGVLCLTSAVVLLLIVPTNTESLRVRWCSELAADFQSLTHWFTAQQKQADKLTLEDLGLQPYPDRLGGNMEELEPELLAVTDADASMLLRMTAFDTFTGENWENDFTTAYRFDGPFSRKQQRLLGNTAMQGSQASNLRARTTVQTLTVTLQKDSYLLPTSGQVTSFTENTETKNPLLFNSNGELLSFFGYKNGFSYTTESLQYPFVEALSDEDYAFFAVAISVGKDSYYDNEKNLKKYLTLPQDYSSQATAIAESLTKKSTCPLDKAMALQMHFSAANGYSYTDHPGPLRTGESIVDKLLTVKQGYSVYYATAMATMARAVGIPSRLVAGYQTAPDTSGTYVVDASRPYAWVECYIRTLGWVAFDPTPRQSNSTVPEMQSKPVEHQVPEIDEEDPEDNADRLSRPQVSRVITVILLILLILMLAALVVRAVLAHRLYTLPVVDKFLKKNAGKTELYYQDILRQLGYIYRPLRRGETVLEWLAQPEFSARLTEDTVAALQQALQPALAMRYGCVPPTGEDVRALAAVRDMLEPVVKAHTRMDLYLLCRRVLLPWLTPAVLKAEMTERKHDR